MKRDPEQMKRAHLDSPLLEATTVANKLGQQGYHGEPEAAMAKEEDDKPKVAAASSKDPGVAVVDEAPREWHDHTASKC